MIKRVSQSILLVLLALAFAVPAYAGAPNFGPAIYADGQVWGTKGTAELPAPNDNNMQSFDGLFIITNSNNPEGQLPVAEAGPTNPGYNGGRWIAYTVEWTESGFAAYGVVPVLKSYEEFLTQYNAGYLSVSLGHPAGTATYFQCPLLPVK
jgi:hypothetical protein